MTHLSLNNLGDPLFGTASESRLVWYRKAPREKGLETAVSTPVDQLGNQLIKLEEALNAEMSEDEKATLMGSVEKGKRYLEAIERPIQSKIGLQEAREEWARLARIAEDLKKEDYGNLAMLEILDSDFVAFLDPKIVSEVELELEILFKEARIKSVFEPKTAQDYQAKAQSDWPNAREALRPEIEKLGKADTKADYLESIETPVAEKLFAMKNIQRYAAKPRGRFSSKISSQALVEAMARIRQAQLILLERFEEYLIAKLDADEARAEQFILRHSAGLEGKTKDREGSADEIREQLNGARKFLKDWIRYFKRLEPDDTRMSLGWDARVQKFLDDHERFSPTLKHAGKELTHAEKHRGVLLRDTNRGQKAATGFLDAFLEPRAKEALQKSLDQERAKVGTSTDTLAKERIEEAEKFLSEFDSNENFIRDYRNFVPADTLRNEALLLAAHDSEWIEKEIRGDGGRAELAQRAIEAIQAGGTVQETLERLKLMLGGEHSKHVEYLKSADFKKYKKYTQTGHMVFYQKGDQWKIIVDRESAEKSGDAALLRGQVVHELRHLKFEGNSALTNQFFLNLGKEDFPKLKDAFVKRYPEKRPSSYKGKKNTFVAADWKDADVLSELFAMAEEPQLIPSGYEDLVRRASRMAEFQTDQGIRSKWEEDYLADIETDDKKRSRWEIIRQRFEKAFPTLLGKPSAGLDNLEILAGLYAMDFKEFRQNAELSSEVSGVEEKILGAEIADKEGAAEEINAEVDKKELANQLEDWLRTGEKNTGKLAIFEQSPYLGRIPGSKAFLDEMRSAVETMKAKIHETDDQGVLKQVKGELEKRKKALEGGDESSLASRITAISESLPPPWGNPLSRFWRDTHIYSIHDFIGIFEHVKDYIHRWEERHAGIKKGNLGKVLYEGVNEGLKLESSSFTSGAWKKTVSDWVDKLEGKNVSKLKSYLHDQAEEAEHTGNADKALTCAVIKVLCKKGAMDWSNKDVWVAINGVNKGHKDATLLDPHDLMLSSNQNYLRAKLKKAFGAAPAFNKMNAFDDMDKENTETFNGNKKKFEPIIASGAVDIGGRLKKLLKESKKDGNDVDPAEYEALIEVSIDRGVCEPEIAMFHLFCGMASGLLTNTAGTRLAADKFNNFPIMDFFNHKKGEFTSAKAIANFCEKNFKNDFKVGMIGAQFRKFYWTQMLNDPTVRSRANKAVETGGKNWDHDWSRGFAMCANANAAYKILMGSSSSPVTVPTQVPNIYGGALQYFEMNSEDKKPVSKDMIVQNIGFYFMFESILCGAAFPGKDSFIRGSNVDMDNPPREHAETSHPALSTSGVESKLNGMMGSLPGVGELFRLATDAGKAEHEAEAHFTACRQFLLTHLPSKKEWVMQKINKIEDFYLNIGNIVQYLLEPMSGESLAAAMRGSLG